MQSIIKKESRQAEATKLIERILLVELVVLAIVGLLSWAFGGSSPACYTQTTLLTL